MSGGIFLLFFVIYLLGTRRTRFHRSRFYYFLFSIKAAEEILTTCLRAWSVSVLKQSISDCLVVTAL